MFLRKTDYEDLILRKIGYEDLILRKIGYEDLILFLLRMVLCLERFQAGTVPSTAKVFIKNNQKL